MTIYHDDKMNEVLIQIYSSREDFSLLCNSLLLSLKL